MFGAQKAQLAALREQLRVRRQQATHLLEEVHLTEKHARRRTQLEAEERALLAQLDAMEGLIRTGQSRLSRAERVSSSSIPEVSDGGGAYGSYTLSGSGAFCSEISEKTSTATNSKSRSKSAAATLFNVISSLLGTASLLKMTTRRVSPIPRSPRRRRMRRMRSMRWQMEEW